MKKKLKLRMLSFVLVCTMCMSLSVCGLEVSALTAVVKEYTMNIGDTMTLYANVSGYDVETASGHWTSNSSAVQVVSQSPYTHSCTIKAVESTGSLTAYVEYRFSYKMSSGMSAVGMEGRSRITVLPPSPASVSLSSTSLSLKIGGSAQLKATVYPDDADQTCTYSSSDVMIASVSDSGRVVAKGEGTARITAKTVNGKTATCTVTVSSTAGNTQETDIPEIIECVNFGGNGNDEYKAVAAANDGYVAVGYSESSSFGTGDWSSVTGKGGDDAIIVKYDKEGKVQWRKNYGGTGNESYNAVAVMENGCVAVGKQGGNAVIVRYDAAGNIVWEKTTEGCYEGVTVAENGCCVAVGTVANYKGSLIVKYDTMGNELWRGGVSREYDEYNAVVAVNDGYVTAGRSYYAATIRKYNTAGKVMWAKSHDDGWLDAEYYTIAVIQDGFVVSGRVGSGSNPITVKYSKSGSQIWERDYVYSRLAADQGGFAAVWRQGISKYDLDGNNIWENNLKGTSSTRANFEGFTVLEDGYMAAGYAEKNCFGMGDLATLQGKGGKDAVLVKYGKKVVVPDNSPTGITLSPGSLRMKIGAWQKLSYTLTPSGATSTVTFTSNNTSVATVDSSGQVTAVGSGTATITASTANGLKASCTVTVEADNTPTGITLIPVGLRMKVGSWQRLSYTLTPSGATSTVTFTSNNTSVATVDSSGWVTAVGSGTATITASTANGLRASCTVTVEADNTPTGITLSRSTLNMKIGDGEWLTYTLFPSGASAEVTFTSSNTSVATVDKSFSGNGFVTAVGSGTATITASTPQGLRATCTVAVETAVVPDDPTDPSDFTYDVLDDGTLRITGYSGTAENVTVPAVIDRRQVTTIGSWAFDSYSGLTSVTLPNSITWIEAWAFRGSITSVNLQDSVPYIHDWAFSQGENITSINVSKGNNKYSSYDGCLYTKDGSELLRCPCGKNSVSLRSGLKTIADGAFRDCSGLTNINLPDGLNEIGMDAFEFCTSLKNISLPDGLNVIGFCAFYYCSSLESIEIPVNVTRIDADAFGNCSSLKDVYYGGSSSQWKEISIYNDGGGNDDLINATLHCSTVAPKKGTTLKSGGNTYVVTKVESEVAFEKPSGSKTTITIPKTVKVDGITYKVTSIGSYAFADNKKIKKVIIGDNVHAIYGDAFSGCTKLTDVTMGTRVKEICFYAFNGCRSLKSINIPKGVTYIGLRTFSDCRSLKSINIPKGVEYIGEEAFSGCSSLESITISKGVTKIDDFLFWGCRNLKSITIPTSVKEIGYSAFDGCSSLKSIVIPTSVKEIGDCAFDGCKNLKSIVIPTSVKEIGYFAFRGCKSLESITIPKNVKKIGKEAFSGCTRLKTITIKSTKLTSVGEKAFKGINSKAKIKVPGKKLTAYKRLLRGKGQGSKVKVVDK